MVLPADGPGFALWRVSNAWQRALRGALQPYGITHAQFVVLATLSWVGGEVASKQHEIAGLAGMDPMTTSQVARSLREAALQPQKSRYWLKTSEKDPAKFANAEGPTSSARGASDQELQFWYDPKSKSSRATVWLPGVPKS